MDIVKIQTPTGELSLHVLKERNEDNHDWIDIYTESFPPDQRQPIDDMRAQLKSGRMELDETRDANDKILCMTVSEIFHPGEGAPPFILACYTAVTPSMRSLGIGTVHRKRVEQLLQSEYGGYLGMIAEIESTKQKTDDPELAQTRIRRKNFFMRLGLIPLDVPYRFPSYDGSEPLEGELLWYPFAGQEITHEEVVPIVRRIYTEGYGLNEKDAFVNDELSGIKDALKDRTIVAAGRT